MNNKLRWRAGEPWRCPYGLVAGLFVNYDQSHTIKCRYLADSPRN